MWQRKAGLVTSWTWGSGFVVARLAPGVWSAPCFLLDRFFSLGLTAGYKTVDTCYAIPTEVGLGPFKNDSLDSFLDFTVTLGTDPYGGDVPHVPMGGMQQGDRTHLVKFYERQEHHVKAFQLSDGAIFDLSWRCGFHMVDEGINEALYGPTIGPKEILEGKVQIPEEFRPLYEAIGELSSIPAVRHTTSQFNVAKEKVKAAALKQSSFRRRTLSSKQSELTSSNSTTFESNGRTATHDEKNGNSLSYNSIISGGSTSVLTNSTPGSPGSSFKLFGDSELLDLDLDSPEEGENDEIQVQVAENATLEPIIERQHSDALTAGN